MKLSATISCTCIGSLLISAQESIAIDSLSDGVLELEKMFIEDCTVDQSRYGFYGAFFQPCEFSFFQSSLSDTAYYDHGENDSCSAERSTRVGKREPVNWVFKLSERIDKDDWGSLSSDDIPDFDELMLWPDQCVAVTPRCYKLRANEDIDDALSKLFPAIGDGSGGIPMEATHVRVDCRTDAMELSRVAYSFASGAEKSIPTLLVWITTVLLLFVAAMSLCCCGCFSVCVSMCRRSNLDIGRDCMKKCCSDRVDSYQVIPASAVIDDIDHIELPINTPVKKYND